MHCMDKGSSLKLSLMIFGSYIVIMIMLISIYVHVCMYCIFLEGHQGSSLFYANDYVYTCVYVCHCLTGSLEIMIVLL